MIWFTFGLMTAAAIVAVLWPLKASKSDNIRSGSDVAVYRDQLDEIARDRTAGLIAGPEAEAAEIEVSRRLIAAAASSDDADKAKRESSVWARRATAFVGIVLMPAGALALYIVLGSPQLTSDSSVGARVQSNAEKSVEAMVGQVETYLARNPDDGRGWEVLAPVYMRLNRFDDAVTAWRNTIRLNGADAPREANYGEALVAAANGAVTTEAKSAFERAIALDPQNVMARFYVGLAAEQEGRRADADKIWDDLIASAPPGAHWLEIVRNAKARAASGRQSATAAPSTVAPDGDRAMAGRSPERDVSLPPLASPPAASTPGPNAADVAAAAQMSEGDRDAMIRGMVTRLADRLKENGNDVEGWQRLLRAYMVLGDRDKAQTAAVDAKRALASEPDKLRRIEDLIKSLGLQG